MPSLSTRIAQAQTLLAPYAVPLEGTLGREIDEQPDETRFPFQRDRDRIIHSQAFRRLQGKTQVFVAGEESDHVRTRLTHTMEVAQLARDISRSLALNEDLAECIALAHDLGHPPFGHRGEEALNAWAQTHGGRFEHNEQSLRIVSVLESKSPQGKGLNLNREVLEGMRKHRRPDDAEQADRRHLSLEAQVVNMADEIAYLGHDTDDGLRSQLFSMTDLRTLPLIREADALAQDRKTHLRSALIHLLVSDLTRETEEEIITRKIRTLDDAYAATDPLVRFSPAMREKASTLLTFLREKMYAHPRVVEAGAEGQRTVRDLCDRLLAAPSEKVLSLQAMTDGTLPEAVMDYVAGMTDGFAKRLIY